MGRLRGSRSGIDGRENEGERLVRRQFRRVMMLQYVQNTVHYPQQKRGLLGVPLNACDDEPRGRCDTKSREHYQVKWDINSVQSYEQQ